MITCAPVAMAALQDQTWWHHQVGLSGWEGGEREGKERGEEEYNTVIVIWPPNYSKWASSGMSSVTMAIRKHTQAKKLHKSGLRQFLLPAQ